MTHHPFFFSMLEVVIANVFSASSFCVIKYWLCYFFQVWCVVQSCFDLFIRDFARRCRCAFMDLAHDKKVGGIVEPRRTSSSFFQGCWRMGWGYYWRAVEAPRNRAKLWGVSWKLLLVVLDKNKEKIGSLSAGKLMVNCECDDSAVKDDFSCSRCIICSRGREAWMLFS